MRLPGELNCLYQGRRQEQAGRSVPCEPKVSLLPGNADRYTGACKTISDAKLALPAPLLCCSSLVIPAVESLLLLADVASLTPQPQTFYDSLQLWIYQWPGGRFGQGWLGEEELGWQPRGPSPQPAIPWGCCWPCAGVMGLPPPREHLVALVQYK